MQRHILILVAATTIGLLQLDETSSYGLLAKPQTFSRRHVLNSLVGFSGISLVTLVDAASASVAVAEDEELVAVSSIDITSDKEIESPQDKKARLLKERIAASKKSYRKADNYAYERFTTVDYSCVADTGSPCKEPKSVFPSDESIARDGKISDL